MDLFKSASTSAITAEMSTIGSSDRIFSATTLNTLQIGPNSKADASGNKDLNNAFPAAAKFKYWRLVSSLTTSAATASSFNFSRSKPLASLILAGASFRSTQNVVVVEI